MSKNVKRLIPFGILIVLIFIVYLIDLRAYFNLDTLRTEQARLHASVTDHPAIFSLIFIGFYIFSVCLIIPDSTILTVLGGFIFPLPLALAYSVFSELIGAMIFFSIFHGVFDLPGLSRERPFIRKLKREFDKYPVGYLLFLRLSHAIPFWLTNLVAAYFKVDYKKFFWTTLIGVIPLSFILTDAGHSLAALFDKHEMLTISDIFTLQVKIALFALGICALIPIIYKKVFGNKWKR